MNYRNTEQRNRILEVVQSTTAHPTASSIYDEVRSVIPSISLGTVYRNLSVLEAQGFIQKISCGDAEERYDATTEPHIHYYCKSCNSVSDVHDNRADERLNKLVSDLDANVSSHSLVCYGKCSKCESKVN
ncbi:MAG: transcriptional repressor [Clostridia bacterium]|jgi:Fur family transcriptional regulator, peroxide stress response regulator|nr:transcriptional repressor [Clostridia bacterium]MBT7122023.1 transcriptional repressor [Clostridia bacterium]